jgi:hypothetical protein
MFSLILSPRSSWKNLIGDLLIRSFQDDWIEIDSLLVIWILCLSGQRVGRVLSLLQLPSFFQGEAGVVIRIQEKSKTQPARWKPVNRKILN